MSDPSFRSSGIAGIDRVGFDAGLRAHMQRVYGYMGGGLAVTGLVALLIGATSLGPLLYGSPLKYIVMLAPLVFVMVLQYRLQTISTSGLKGLFFAFCATMGLSLGAIFLFYTGASVGRAFFITSATFGTMSLWGYTTKKDLSGMGAIMMMGVLGIFIASVVNIFLASSMLQWMVSIVGVVVFTGLTAWDTQRIKQTYSEAYGVDANDKSAVLSALQLYLNFINAFQFILSLTGDRR